MYWTKNFLIFALVFAISLNQTLSAKCICKKNNVKESDKADYIIVGVGTAGAVLAKKLSEDKINSVIAIHSGENLTQDPEIKFSKNAFTTVLSAIFGPPFFENGFTVPQQSADNKELLWAIGLPEGGASSVNAGAWARETTLSNLEWEEIAGPNWSSERILNIYKELENYHGKTEDPSARGFHGPISIRQVANPSKISQKFTRAVIKATELPFVLDYNDPTTPIGVSSQLQYTQSGPNGQLRVSSATAFLNEKVITPEGFGVNGRKLRVFFDSKALKAIWKGNTAIGVEYVQNGIHKQAFANKGVIVCAGLKSSTFLMHSGVGSASLLNSLKIPVKFNNPNVGNGLADQATIYTVFTSNPADTPKNSNSIFANISWMPDPNGDPMVRKVRFTTTQVIPGITIALLDLVLPKSRGQITINSSNPLDPPVINEGILSNNDDLKLFRDALQIYLKNISTEITKIDPTYRLIFPPPEILSNSSFVTLFIKHTVQSNQCFQSHCRMAPLDQGGVVDGFGRVYGVRNLFVADDSIVPQSMDGTTMASAYLIATNIAKLILHE